MNYIVTNPTKIGCYIQTSTLKSIASVKQKVNADVISNFQMFNWSDYSAAFVLKAEGKVYGNDGTNYYGYAWNNRDRKLTFTTASEMDKYENFAGCICVVKDGKAITKPDYPPEIGGMRGRTCIGLRADGSIVVYCWPDGSSGACSMEQLGKKMVDLGCVNAINYDGGGSCQMICPDGKVSSTRAVASFLYFRLEDSQTKTDCPYSEPTRNIKKGSTGDDAAWVQWHLNKFGASLSVDGIFGTKSVSALKQFQRNKNLTVDGICGAATRAELKKYNNSTPVPSKEPYPEPTRNIRYGMTGEDVKWVQYYLNKHGAKLNIDGDFGKKSESALIAFQTLSNLDADGVCGALTRNALKTKKIDISQNLLSNNDLVSKREKMLDIIETFVGGLYVFGAQGQEATENIIDWSARNFPMYTTSERAARMKKYIKTHKGLKAADCSGLFWAAENIVELPLSSVDVDDSTAEGLYNTYCYPISKNELQPLDLVFDTNLTHVAIVGRNGRIYEAAGSDIGIVVNDNVEDRIVPSIFGPEYGCSAQYQKSKWTKFGRLKIYKDVPYSGR